ncbi:MAG: hypothetical protein K0U84_18540 [Actinomycetia bacterium]|nr:hypothetical protein [Actinomycetes bacterium]
MSRILAWLAAALFSAAWWSVFFSLTAFGILLALSAGCVIASEMIWHVRYWRAYRRHPSQQLVVVGGGEQ